MTSFLGRDGNGKGFIVKIPVFLGDGDFSADHKIPT